MINSKTRYDVEFVDGGRIIVLDPNKITEAVVGLCIYNNDGASNTLYPWHRIKQINRKQTQGE